MMMLGKNIPCCSNNFWIFGVNANQGFIRKYFELNQDEPMTELTACTGMDSQFGKKRVCWNTISFFSIYENMKRIVNQTEDNPDSHQSFLKEERKK